REKKMTRLTAIAIILGATLLAGCTVSKEGTSLSEFKWIDNNCTGNGYVQNPDWCRNKLHPSMGPYAAKS
ncbi:MAG TPA: hypothetical protein VGJ75_14410, partial [Dongiaceae bacterium]